MFSNSEEGLCRQEIRDYKISNWNAFDEATMRTDAWSSDEEHEPLPHRQGEEACAEIMLRERKQWGRKRYVEMWGRFLEFCPGPLWRKRSRTSPHVHNKQSIMVPARGFDFVFYHRRDRCQSTPKHEQLCCGHASLQSNRHINHKRCKCNVPQAIEILVENVTQKQPMQHPFTVAKSATWRKRRPPPRNTLPTNRNLKESEVCTDKNQRCGTSRWRPEKHLLVTV